MRILICGDRNWSNLKKILEALKKENSPPGRVEVVIEGGAKGADLMGKAAAVTLGIPVMEFPAEWEFYGLKAGPLRNFWMLKHGKPDLVLAFHSDLEHSKGTKNMVERAMKAQIPVRVIK